MLKWDTGGARHLLMRAGLAFVMAWFGVQELRNPSEWAVFVPSFVVHASPVAVNDLVLLHGFLLLLAAASVGLGVVYLAGCVLAVGLLADIVFGLWYSDGLNDLVIRDVGLLAVAGGLALDQARVWHLDKVTAKLFEAAGSRAERRRAGKTGRVSTERPAWITQAVGAAGLVAVVVGMSAVLHAAGSSGSGLPGGAVTAQPGSPSGSGAPNATPARPAPGPTSATAQSKSATGLVASTTKFSDWRWAAKSYQVYPGALSADAEKALAGFQLSVQDQGDSVLLLLKATSSRYRDHQQVIAKTDTAYFVETSMRDDPAGRENELDDDGLIVVNPDGYIMQQAQ